MSVRVQRFLGDFTGGSFHKKHGSGDRSGGGKYGGDKRGGGKFTGGRERGDKPAQLFSANCSACSKSCQVPFRPSGDKPVYCSDCFGKRQDDEKRGGDRRDTRPQRHDGPVRQEHTNDRRRDADTELRKRLSDIEGKLNRILDLINPPTPPKEKQADVSQDNSSAPVSKKSQPKPGKKVVDTKALQQVVAQAIAPVKKISKKVAKKAPAKKVAKKVVKKVAAKKTK